jgi:LPXTG-motif cell wall-anchored protein
VMAKGFKPGEKVVLRIGAGKTTTLIANAQGEVRLELVLGITSRGKNQVVASAASGGRSAKSEIRVTAPQVLPATGSTTTPLVMWGVITTLLGSAVLSRRRLQRK